MKAARIALRTAAPLAGAGSGSAGRGGSSSSSRLPREVEQFSRFSPSPLSIKQLLDFGESHGAVPGSPWGRGVAGGSVLGEGRRRRPSPQAPSEGCAAVAGLCAGPLMGFGAWGRQQRAQNSLYPAAVPCWQPPSLP